jgi:hypothetical protein
MRSVNCFIRPTELRTLTPPGTACQQPADLFKKQVFALSLTDPKFASKSGVIENSDPTNRKLKVSFAICS